MMRTRVPTGGSSVYPVGESREPGRRDRPTRTIKHLRRPNCARSSFCKEFAEASPEGSAAEPAPAGPIDPVAAMDGVAEAAEALKSEFFAGDSALDQLNDVQLDVRVELGRSRMLVDDVLRLGSGSVVELDRLRAIRSTSSSTTAWWPGAKWWCWTRDFACGLQKYWDGPRREFERSLGSAEGMESRLSDAEASF